MFDSVEAGTFIDIKALMDQKVVEYNQPEFIAEDPVCIPHAFIEKQDREIAGFFAALLAWGQRKTIINKCNELMDRMDRAPYQFMLQYEATDLKKLLGFKHRTFNDTDLLYFVAFFRLHYQQYESLEDAFLIGKDYTPFRSDFTEEGTEWEGERTFASSACFQGEFEQPLAEKQPFNIETALINFRRYFFSLPDYPERTGKHISSPLKKSTCKRLNMFLRWMVRNDDQGVDFGLWNRLTPDMLICPYDVHVDRVSRKLGLVRRKQRDWRTTLELTDTLRSFDAKDPVKYDFALFGMGVLGEL